MKFFTNCKTLDDLKREYRRLAMKYRPDRGGDVETMKQINAEHDRLFEILKAEQNRRADADTTHKTRRTTETAAEFRQIINELLKIDGLDVELCGSWLWIGGNTRENKEQLKMLGCKWSNNKKLWYWRHEEDAMPKFKNMKSRSMDYIRDVYGSQKFERNSGAEIMTA